MGFLDNDRASNSSQQQSQYSASNRAYQPLLNALGPLLSGGASRLRGLLGLGGSAPDFNAFRNTPGYKFNLQEGENFITNSLSGRGLLNSGEAVKKRLEFSQGLADQTFQKYLDNVLGATFGAGGLVSGAGGISQGTSSGTSSGQGEGGTGNFIGGLIGAIGSIFSDERLKRNMKHIDTDKNGLRYYSWEWNEMAKRKFGLPDGEVMGLSAQDLRSTKFAHAVVEREGYDAIMYDLLPQAEYEDKEAA